jgi:cell division transport system permease protein
MFSTIIRVSTFALQNFWRNIWLSVVTVTIVTVSLFSVSMLGVLIYLSNTALSNLQQKIDIAVYLKPELKDEQVVNLKGKIEQLQGVQSLEVVTPAQALERFKAKHQNDPLIAESILELGSNPLGTTFIVKAETEDSYSNILQQLQTKDYTPYIQEARFDDYQKVIDSIAGLTAKVKRLGFAISLMFLLVTLLVVFNTIRINIYTHREEIGIMRLVGATSWFIRGPFWAESVLYALVATLVTAALFFPMLQLSEPYVNAFFSGFELDLVGYFTRNSLLFFGAQFLGVMALNILASSVAMRRYLKV